MKIKKTPSRTKAYQIEPPRCKRSLTPEAAIRLMDKDCTYLAELKLDGHRYLLQVRPNNSPRNFLTSRRISVITGNYGEAQEDLPFIRDHIFPLGWDDTIFDGEIVGGKMSSDTQHEIAQGRGEYHVWDILFFRGKDLRRLPYSQRRRILTQIKGEFPKWMHVVEARPMESGRSLEDYLTQLRKEGQEGCILKHPGDAYGEEWIKVKFEETHDVIIIGYQMSTEGKYAKHGWIKSLEIGQYNSKTKKVVNVGRASGFDERLRKQFSENQKAHLNQVIEIKVQQRLSSGKFRHPRFIRFRGDKAPEQCVFTPKVG